MRDGNSRAPPLCWAGQSTRRQSSDPASFILRNFPGLAPVVTQIYIVAKRQKQIAQGLSFPRSVLAAAQRRSVAHGLRRVDYTQIEQRAAEPHKQVVVGETHGRRSPVVTEAVKRRQRSSMENLSPFHGFPVPVVRMPRVDTRGKMLQSPSRLATHIVLKNLCVNNTAYAVGYVLSPLRG